MSSKHYKLTGYKAFSRRGVRSHAHALAHSSSSLGVLYIARAQPTRRPHFLRIT